MGLLKFLNSVTVGSFFLTLIGAKLKFRFTTSNFCVPVTVKFLFLRERQAVNKYILCQECCYEDKPVREIENEWVELTWRVVREGLSNKMTLHIG